ncbi:hypothetical protein ACHAXT_004648 [Thalassiosira profunda]
MAALARTAACLAPRTAARAFVTRSPAAAGSVSLAPNHRAHLLFGANTDVGKSIVSTGLVRAAAAASDRVHYIKPLQCGGSDASFVLQNRPGDERQRREHVKCETLFRWETPASPHLASRWEDLPVSDDEVLSTLQKSLQKIDADARQNEGTSVTIIETAGGVLSPSSSSPRNKATTESFWGWSTQADLYASLNLPVVFVGDGKLGGISVTLASLEALWRRGYRVDAIVFIEGQDGGESEDDIKFGRGNTEALQEYMAMQVTDGQRPLGEDSIICLPSLPPMPIPLDAWYESNRGAFAELHRSLSQG